jgi:sodium-dependent dicarboxylate transporter 2/3/5
VRTAEVVTLVVFLLAVTLWIGRDLIAPALGLVYVNAEGKTWSALTDGSIAIVAALLLFVIPAERGASGAHRAVLVARDIDTVPWSILILFGGGLSLAAAMKASGVDVYLGSLFEGLSGLPTLVLLLVIAVSITMLSELASNTAVAATTLPILAAAATGLGVHPYVLMIPATLAASCGFMLPVATPPNAIVFGTGRLTVWEMARAGFLMDLIAVGTIAVFFWLAGAPLLGLEGPVGK